MIRGIVFERLADKLVVEATPAEIAGLALGAPVGVAQISGATDLQAQAASLCGATLYDGDGRPVAMVTSVTIERPRFDVTSFGDAQQVFAYGPPRHVLEVEALF